MSEVSGVDQPSQAGHGVKADHVGGDDVGPRGIRDLASREQCRQQGHTWVPDHRLVHVVVVERVAGCAVRHRSAGRRRAIGATDDGRAARTSLICEKRPDDACGRLS